MEEKDYYRQLKDFACKEGASLFGVAKTSALQEQINFLSPQAMKGMERAVSLAFHLSDRVLEDIVEGPTKL
ncbi:MAG: hypothetical protein NTY64_09740, partial [Deltaproteobacteria bacterium]|nr:hypothetical protein [Deltaproteobacteria bacterium]